MDKVSCKVPMLKHHVVSAVLFSWIGATLPLPAFAQEFLNVSYDPTRELYQDFNKAFAKKWKQQAGQDVTFKQSHGGSDKQARGGDGRS